MVNSASQIMFFWTWTYVVNQLQIVCSALLMPSFSTTSTSDLLLPPDILHSSSLREGSHERLVPSALGDIFEAWLTLRELEALRVRASAVECGGRYAGEALENVECIVRNERNVAFVTAVEVFVKRIVKTAILDYGQTRSSTQFKIKGRGV